MMHEKLTGRRRAAAGIAIAGLALAGCGSVAAPSGGAAGSGGSSSPAAAPKASLTITVQNGPGKKISHWTLQCDPAGGTHPDPAKACAALLAVKNPFAPIRTGQVCPMILASARRATFTGTWFGVKVNRTVIDGGCDLTNWTRFSPVVN